MSDSTLHLKLDRILAGQVSAAVQATEQNESLEALIAGLSRFADSFDTLAEVVARLAAALSKEEGTGELRELLVQIVQRLEAIQDTSGRTLDAVHHMHPANAPG